MPAAAPHPQEDARLAALKSLKLLDSLEESAYDDVVHLAADLCGVPIAAISLVDEDRQWFKAITGLDVRETPRSQAFCAHAILDCSEPLVVPDATSDPRFIDNPLVKLNPKIRFYVGVPILTQDEFPIGTLCVIHQQPMEISEQQLASLTRLAKHVEKLIELRQAAEELKVVQQRLRLNQFAVDQSSEIILWVRQDGTIAYANEQAHCQFGHSREKLCQMHASELQPAESQDDWTRRWDQVKQEEAIELEASFVRADRNEMKCEVTCRYVGFEGTEFALVTIRDTTEKKRTHLALMRTQTALDLAADAVLWVSPMGKIIYANQEACRRLQYSRQELLELTVADINPDVETVERFQAQFWPRIEANRSVIYTLRHQRKDGTIFPIEIATNLIDYDGELFTCSFVRDLTERQLEQEELARYASDLETANDDLEQFAYVASHDLKQPLRGIDNLASWIEEDAGDVLPAESQEFLAKLRGRVKRMDDLLDDLLEYSRIGRRSRPVESVDVGSVVSDAIALLDPPNGFRIQVADRFPTIETHRAPLEQVFRNLISNAIMHREIDQGQVTVDWSDDSGQITFTVRDNGPGIAREFHERAFRMFQTLQRRENVESSGMGLALVKKLVESRGGSIVLESSLGKGAAFSFTWPT